LLLVPIPSLIFSLLLNESRSYWLAFLTFFILLLFLNLRSNKKLAVASIAALLLTGTVISQVPVLKSRFQSIVDTKNNGSNTTRLMIWKSHIKAFVEDYSLLEKTFGAGNKANRLAWNHFGKAYQEISGKPVPSEEELKKWFHGGETHNIYLKFLTKYGVLGLLGYLSFWGYVFYYNLLQAKRIENPAFIWAFVAGYAGFLVAGLFENNFTDAEVQFALLFNLGINLALLERTGEETRKKTREKF